MPNNNTNHNKSLALLTILFFMWGFLTCMNDILIPYLKSVFELSHFQAMLIQFAFFSAYFIGSLIYFIISVNHGDPINKIGYQNGIVLGLIISSVGAFLFYPAAELVSYGFFLSALFVLAMGFALLQISANPYVAILGKEESASSRLNLAQGFNSFGGFLIFRFFAGNDAVGADSVKIPYLVFAAVLLLLAVFMKIVKLPRFTREEQVEKGVGVLKYPHLVFGIVAIFMYVGGEVSIGSIMISFFGLEEIAGLSKDEGSTYLAFYWGGLMIGRFLGAISLSKMESRIKKILLMVGSAIVSFATICLAVSLKDDGFNFGQLLPFTVLVFFSFLAFLVGRSLPGRTLVVFALIAVSLLISAVCTEGKTAMWSVIGVGLFSSIMWSNIFTLAIAGLGKYTSQGSSLLVMAIIGGAILPPVQGAFADAFGVHLSFVVPIISYLYIAFYGWKGHVIRQPVETGNSN